MTGYERANGYIDAANIPLGDQVVVRVEATIRSHMLDHLSYTDAIYEVVQEYLRGDDWRRYTRRNSEILRSESDVWTVLF